MILVVTTLTLLLLQITYLYNVKESVGIVIIAKDTNNFLLLHRSKDPIVWSTLSGKMEEGEKPLEALKREIQEEIRISPDFIDGIKEVGQSVTDTKYHHVFIGFVDREFEITNIKKDENDDYGWFNEKTIPAPMHKRWGDAFQLIKPILHLRENLTTGFKKLLNESTQGRRKRT